MPRAAAQIVQSFRLRFWWEPGNGLAGHWRGTAWHEGQESDEQPRAVADPDEAFSFVRRVLSAAVPAEDRRGKR